jgi:hypothetical protein
VSIKKLEECAGTLRHSQGRTTQLSATQSMPCCAVDHLRSEREDHSVPVYYHRTNRRAKMAATLQCESMASASPLITSTSPRAFPQQASQSSFALCLKTATRGVGDGTSWMACLPVPCPNRCRPVSPQNGSAYLCVSARSVPEFAPNSRRMAARGSFAAARIIICATPDNRKAILVKSVPQSP